MKKICLVQGGKFLLGIDAEHIVSRTAWADVGPLRREGRRIVHLGALLARRPAVVQPEAICLELAGREGAFFLLVDRIDDEVEAESEPRPLPPACPFLAARLCPQVAICRNSAVLLLDPAQTIPVCEQLGGGIGLLALEAVSSLPDSETRPAALQATDAADGPAMDLGPSELSAASPSEGRPAALQATDAANGPAMDLGPSELSAASPSEGRPAALATRKDWAAEKERHERSSAIDEETFKKVMSWTIARFKQKQPGEQLHLGMEHLPSDLAGMVQKKGLSRSVVQYLIDQIVLRCQESVHRKMPEDSHVG